MSKFTPMTAERFWNKVDKSKGPDGCWPWMGAITRGGYGRATINYKSVGAHRAAWFYTNGAIKFGLFVCHICDNPTCCNPAHLFLGDVQDNASDMVSKGRQSRGQSHSKAILPGRKRGEDHYAHKLTEDQVREIIALRASGMAIVDICKRFNSPKGTIDKIIRRKTWKHLDIPRPPNKRPFKLTDAQVLEMRRMREEQGTPIKALADHFGITVWTVNDIIYRRTRTNI